MVRGYGERLKKLRRLGLSQAWHAAAFERASPLPDLAEILRDGDEEREPQGDDAMTFNLASFAAATQAGEI
ncbi:hypothetical protein HRV97_03135 [Sphingomonas sp. HHU CXW]|uniref:Uncharacterized protein n=1 Tax=Sphingomonas hominis TaxID=2741495 RepID=A0ABX2JFN1_9SPHN|nr:hypothetical protein [Sphingomonas hominis]NTS64155.1 hypothetical protein [Sphingomonas hominis]